MKSLLGKIKIVEDNLKILHRNVVGAGWQSDHPKFGEYYEKISDLEDDIAEMIIMLGGDDINIADAIECYRPIVVKKYTIAEAYKISKTYFNDLVEALMRYRELVPCDCQSEIDTWIFWLRKEANYKISHTLASF